MLSIPTACFYRSVGNHNIELDAFCDWIEASVLFAEDNILTRTDVVDALVEGEIYAEQDYAREMVANGWRELRRRQDWMGAGSSIEVAGQRIQRTCEWRDNAAHSFLITLSLAKLYPNWAGHFGKNFTEQGALFEELTKQSLEILFPRWGVYVTGWSRAKAKKLAAVAQEVANRVCEPIGELLPWTKPKANEAGLDVICYYGFGDDKGGAPVYLIQCASGVKWDSKLHTPEIRLWRKVIAFSCDPQKAFAIPFALTDAEFKRICNLVNGTILDRYRILLPGATNPNWVDVDLKARLVAWLESRIDYLLWDYE